MEFAWVPLHARDVVRAEGFSDFAGRPRRLRLFLEAYGWAGPTSDVLDAVHARITAHINDVLRLAHTDPLFARLVESGTIGALTQALAELAADRCDLCAD